MTAVVHPGEIDELFASARGGDRRSLGRLLSTVEHSIADADRVDAVASATPGSAHVLGLTGAPGVGKSTLTGRLVRCATLAGRRPAVLAVDPSSPRHGGAILGDRLRMDDVVGPEVYIRSMASRGQLGGLAMAVPCAVRTLDAVGYDPIVVETVGVGQVEVDIAAATDTTVVLVSPGWGDAVQANKSGLLEVADLFVINKADRGDADAAHRDLAHMLDLGTFDDHDASKGPRPEIVRAVATSDDGVEDVWLAIERHRLQLSTSGALAARRAERYRDEVRSRVAAMVGERIDDDLGRVSWDEHSGSVGDAARQIVARLLG